MKKIHLSLVACGLLFCSFSSYAQTPEAEDEDVVLEEDDFGEIEELDGPEEIGETFNSSRIINGHSVETLYKGYLEFRIGHRFGDIAGGNGGVQTLFGFDNVGDMRFGFEYGVTDDLMLGIGRSKGTGAPYKALLDGFIKYRILRQNPGTMPVSLAVIGSTSYTYMTASSDLTQVASFPKQSHRFAYSTQLNLARKFGERISLSLMPTVVHRNLVATDDVNTLFSLGGGARIGITSNLAILLEYYHNFHDSNIRTTNTNSLGVAIEWITYGHSFTLNFTNSKGFGDTQFIPYTYENWLDGEFRLGFSITRAFTKG